jgi:hypothetical protein
MRITCIHVFMHSLRACASVCLYAYTHALYAYIYAHIHRCIHIRTHTYAHIHRHSQRHTPKCNIACKSSIPFPFYTCDQTITHNNKVTLSTACMQLCSKAHEGTIHVGIHTIAWKPPTHSYSNSVEKSNKKNQNTTVGNVL